MLTIIKLVPIALLVIFILILLPGCVKGPSYTINKLMPLDQPSADFETTEHNITLRVKKFNAGDCAQLFDGNGKRMVQGRLAIYPLQISVKNNRPEPIILSRGGIDLTLTDEKKIVRKLSSNSFMRSMGTLVIGTIAAPFATTFGIKIASAGYAGLYLLPLFTFAIFAVPGWLLFTGGASMNINKLIKHHIYDIALINKEVIYPQQEINTVVFVQRKHLKKEFVIRMSDYAYGTDPLVFTVTLPH